MERVTGVPRAGFAVPLWRALAVFRLAALGYAAALVVSDFRHYQHPAWGWPVLAVMAAWTVVTVYAYRGSGPPRWPLLASDLAVAAACLLSTRPVVDWHGIGSDRPTLPMVWIGGPVLAVAISGGRRRGLLAALLLGGCDVYARGRLAQATLTGTVLLVLAALAVGHVARLAVTAEQRLQQAAELAAATRERDRIARDIHDSVLQVLALVARRGQELGGEAAELGRLAGQQETALRTLVRDTAREGEDTNEVDLRTVLERFGTPGVSVATPATPVPLPAGTAGELAAAVAEALSNVERHVGTGAPAWILVEDGGRAVTVTVRDDGPGIPHGRLSEAAADGRLGVARSIQGRLADLGGTATVTSAPGQGTEVELRVYRDHRD
jgi:signal transduction histidine kinase